MSLWHLIVHLLGVDYGLPYGHWGWYNFWSGVGGSFLIASVTWLFAGFPLWYYHHSCHDHPACLRWGKYAAAGGTFKLCWKHHPDMGVKPHRELIHRLHREWLDRAA